MPKVARDAELHERLKNFLLERGLSVAQAAKEFGVDRVSLWRFSATGKALENKKAEYKKALDRATSIKTETNTTVSFRENLVRSKVSIEDRELRRIRQACESVLRLLDVYEGRFSSSTYQRH